MRIEKGQIVLYTNEDYGNTPIQRAYNRPAVVVSNNNCNIHSPIITIVPLTTKKLSKVMPTHAFIKREKGDTNVALCEQVISVAKEGVIPTKNFVTKEELEDIELSLMVQLGLIRKKPSLENKKGTNEAPLKTEQETCENSKPKDDTENELLYMAKEIVEANMKFLVELNKRIEEKK